MELGSSDVRLSPFWKTVHRRHPDVTLVLLADEPPASVEGPDLPAGTIDAVVDRVVAYATGAWAFATERTEIDGTGPVDFAPEVRLRYGPREDTVAAEARASAHLSTSPLPMLAQSLAAGGWHAVRPAGAAERLVARRGGVELLASYAPTGTFVLTVTSAPISVGVDRARELVR